MITNATAVWRETDRRHHLHPFTDTRLLNEQGVRVITRAEGVYLWDSEGNRLLDGMAGLWCVQLGYGRRELRDAALRQFDELPYYNTFFQSATPPVIELSETLAALTPDGFNHVFFANSGSEANDTIAKMVRLYWNVMGRTSKKTIISREYAYHGVTMAATSLSGLGPMHTPFDLPLPGFAHVAAPYWYREGGDADPAAFGLAAAQTLEDRIKTLGPENVAAFIGEPVMGAGGVIVPPETYWPEIQRICEKYEVLLIADEVICGFGRTGNWFGCETFGIRPDFMTLAKGLSSGYLPISGVMVHDRVAGPIIEKGGEFTHGFTYSGHPVACAVALENLRIMRDENVVERVGGDTGPYFQARLRELADHPLVGEVRGVGMVAGIELVADKAARKSFDPDRKVGNACRDASIANGLVMRAVRDVMVLSPPLVITRDEIDALVAMARKSLDQTRESLGL
ncbi:MAG: aspartate aminotransferase family protein [Alphaproteobacteria bacterium]